MKPFEVKGWSHIMIEGYCTINQEYHSKHSKWVYGWKGNKNPEDRGKKPNPEYDPNVKPNKKSGTVIGTYQILEMLENIAIEEGMVECPHCHRK